MKGNMTPEGEQAAPAKDREFRCLSMKHILKLISALILPVVLGVFTIVITFHQQKMAREQRLGDQHQLRQQPQQELSM